jgi:hypothetical protein
MIKNVVGSVAGAVLTAVILYHIGINADGEPIQPAPADEASPAAGFVPAGDTPLSLLVEDALSYDARGSGQSYEEVMLTLAGETRHLRLSHDRPRGSLAFHVPRPGRYTYLLRVTTDFNDHAAYGHPVPCRHVSERRAEIDVRADMRLSLAMGWDEHTGDYQVWIEPPRAAATRAPAQTAPAPVDTAAVPAGWGFE